MSGSHWSAVSLLYSQTPHLKNGNFRRNLTVKCSRFLVEKRSDIPIHTPFQVSKWKWKLDVLRCQKIARKSLANVEGKWYSFSHCCSIFNVRSDRGTSSSSPFEIKWLLFSIFLSITQVNYFNWKIHTAIFKPISATLRRSQHEIYPTWNRE